MTLQKPFINKKRSDFILKKKRVQSAKDNIKGMTKSERLRDDVIKNLNDHNSPRGILRSSSYSGFSP